MGYSRRYKERYCRRLPNRAQPEFREKLQAQGFDLVGSSPEEFRAGIRPE